MKLLGNDIVEIAPDFVIETGVEMTSLKVLLRRSDFVSINWDLNPTSYHLINAEALAGMKPDAVLINTARGPVVDELALIESLRRGELGGAALLGTETYMVTTVRGDHDWSPDGEQVLWGHSTGVSKPTYLHITDISDPTYNWRLTDTLGGRGVWSCQDEIAWLGGGGISLIQPNGEGETLLYDKRDNVTLMHLHWSPDGEYLTYMSDPSAGARTRLGVWVLLFLTVFTVFAWWMNREYWKDVK